MHDGKEAWVSLHFSYHIAPVSGMVLIEVCLCECNTSAFHFWNGAISNSSIAFPYESYFGSGWAELNEIVDQREEAKKARTDGQS